MAKPTTGFGNFLLGRTGGAAGDAAFAAVNPLLYDKMLKIRAGASTSSATVETAFQMVAFAGRNGDNVLLRAFANDDRASVNKHARELFADWASGEPDEDPVVKRTRTLCSLDDIKFAARITKLAAKNYDLGCVGKRVVALDDGLFVETAWEFIAHMREVPSPTNTGPVLAVAEALFERAETSMRAGQSHRPFGGWTRSVAGRCVASDVPISLLEVHCAIASGLVVGVAFGPRALTDTAAQWLMAEATKAEPDLHMGAFIAVARNMMSARQLEEFFGALRRSDVIRAAACDVFEAAAFSANSDLYRVAKRNFEVVSSQDTFRGVLSHGFVFASPMTTNAEMVSLWDKFGGKPGLVRALIAADTDRRQFIANTVTRDLNVKLGIVNWVDIALQQAVKTFQPEQFDACDIADTVAVWANTDGVVREIVTCSYTNGGPVSELVAAKLEELCGADPVKWRTAWTLATKLSGGLDDLERAVKATTTTRRARLVTN